MKSRWNDDQIMMRDDDGGGYHGLNQYTGSERENGENG